MKLKNICFVLMMFAGTVSAQEVIDIHSHIIIPEYISILEKHDAMMSEGFPLPEYDWDRHLKWMDEAGIQTSVLTLAAPQPYFGDIAESAKMIRRINEESARLKKEHPGRFMFCAALPLPDVDAAIEEVKYAFDVLKADGIKLATNVHGQYLGSPELDDLFLELDKRHAVVILHPHCPDPVNASVMAQTPLAMQEYLSETTRAVSNMISRNLLVRYPNIRVVVPHCGAYLPLAIPRMKSLTPVMREKGLVSQIDYDANLAALYYDLAGAHSPEAIRMLLTITTPDHLLYGSDYPYAAPQVLKAGLERMKQYLSDEKDLAPFRKMILEENARWLFGMANKPSAKATDIKSLVVRIAEIEVYPEYLEKYLTAARTVGAESVARESGVICIFPMQKKETPNLIRIVEIYRSEDAYKKHLATPHFRVYKEGTPHMIKSLELVPMQPLDVENMNLIFKKAEK